MSTDAAFSANGRLFGLTQFSVSRLVAQLIADSGLTESDARALIRREAARVGGIIVEDEVLWMPVDDEHDQSARPVDALDPAQLDVGGGARAGDEG